MRLVGITLVLSVLIFALLYWRISGSQNTTNTNNSLTNFVYQASEQLQQWLGNNQIKTPTDDGHTSTEGARWPQAKATIYIASQDTTILSAYEAAIQSWNQTGAFLFEISDSEQKADIVATDVNDSSISAAGLAESETNLLTKRFTHVTVKLNQYYLRNPLYGYNFERIVNTAEHELGHAIGLEHNENISVMQSSGSYYSIQPVDIAAVKNLYQN